MKNLMSEKNFCSLLLLVLFSGILLIACSDKCANASKEPTQTFSADYEVFQFENLPNCNLSKKGKTAYVEFVGKEYVCDCREWVDVEFPQMLDDGIDRARNDHAYDSILALYDKFSKDFSCTDDYSSQKNDDNPLVEIDSIVVIDPETGGIIIKIDTIAVDSADFQKQDIVKIVNGTFNGVAQKGPFLQGANAFIIPLDDKSLTPTGDTIVKSIEDNEGHFSFSNINLPNQYAKIEVYGYYRSELSGQKNNLQTRLSAVVDLQKESNVNVLTEIESERVKHLVLNEGYNIAGAQKRSLSELLSTLYIENFSGMAGQLDLTETGTGNAALMAITLMFLNSAKTEFDVIEIMKRFRDDFKENGAWTLTKDRAAMADGAFNANEQFFLGKYRHIVESWNLSKEISFFEGFVNDFWGEEYGIGKCTEERFGEIQKNKNASSVYNEKFFICDTMWFVTDLSNENRQSGYQARPEKCWKNKAAVDCWKGNKIFYWRSIDFLNYNTNGQGCKDYAVPGIIDKDKYFICENGIWREAVGIEVDKRYTECSKDGKLNKFSDGLFYACDADTFKLASPIDKWFDVACVSYTDGMIKGMGKCYHGHWYWTGTYGSLKDSRDGQEYKIVPIGDNLWMAENLNYGDSIKTEEIKENSWCYDNELTNCQKYGRLYNQTVIDKVCPENWHVPGIEEWKSLFSLAGMNLESKFGTSFGNTFKSMSDWNRGEDGTNEYGFSALPAGQYAHFEDVDKLVGSRYKFYDLGYGTYFWIGNPFGNMFSVNLNNGGEFYVNDWYSGGDIRHYAYSVRCVRD